MPHMPAMGQLHSGSVQAIQKLQCAKENRKETEGINDEADAVYEQKQKQLSDVIKM